jgi:hypothetical protein
MRETHYINSNRNTFKVEHFDLDPTLGVENALIVVREHIFPDIDRAVVMDRIEVISIQPCTEGDNYGLWRTRITGRLRDE